MASIHPIWVKIADFGTSKQTKFTALRTTCGTQGYIAPELLGVVRRSPEGYSYALDMWSLGCLLHELLTSQTPFLTSTATPTSDFITGLSESDFEQETDLEFLFKYCHGTVGFPTGKLESAGASVDAINLVQELLSANATDRPTAKEISHHPWLEDSRLYNYRWFASLERELLHLGVILDLSQNKCNKSQLIRQLVERDIVKFFPPVAKEEVSTLLYRALTKDLRIITSALLRSPNPAITNSMEQVFQWAVRDGQIGTVDALLATNHPNIVNFMVNDETPLQIAASHGDLAMVKLLLKNGANINLEPGLCEGRTALQAAAGKGHISVVTVLLSEGADIYAMPPFLGRTAIHEAVASGHIAVVRLLLDTHQALRDPTESIGIDWDAVKLAVAGNRIDIVKLILSKDSSPELGDGAITALRAAVEHSHLDTVNLLLSLGVDPNGCPDEAGDKTTLVIAAGTGRIDIVNALLSVGARLNARVKPSNCRTALSSAAHIGNVAIVKLLISHGARINEAQLSDFGLTPLQAAAEGGHTELVKLLLAKGSFVNSPCNVARSGTALRLGGGENLPAYLKTIEGSGTALHAAAEGGHADVVKLLLNAGANMNKRRACGKQETALAYASRFGHAATVKLLLSHGAQVHCSRGWGPIQEAAEQGRLDILKLLLLNNHVEREISTASQAATRSGHTRIVDLLIEHGTGRAVRSVANLPGSLDNTCAPPTTYLTGRCPPHVSTYGIPALHVATRNGNMHHVKMLLEQGADINAVFERKTALYLAAGRGDLEIVKLLHNKGASVQGWPGPNWVRPPLQSAAKHGRLRMVQLLLRKGADVNAGLGYISETALYEASKNGHAAVVECLLDVGARPHTPPNLLISLNHLLVGDIGYDELRVESAPHAAITGGHGEVVKILISKRVPIIQDQWEESFGHAAFRGYIDIARMLLPDSTDFPSSTSYMVPFTQAITGGQIEIVKLFLSRGVQPTYELIYPAIDSAQVNLVKLLLCFPQVVMGLKREPTTAALTTAVGNGYIDIVKVLLDAGALVNSQGYKKSHKALRAAIEGGHTDIVRLLVSSGATVDAACGPLKTSTALWHAVHGQHVDIVRILFAAKATIRSKQGIQLLDETEDIDIVQLIFQNMDAAADKRLLRWVSEKGSNDIWRVFTIAGGPTQPMPNPGSWRRLIRNSVVG